MPRHKGKIESGVKYMKNNALKAKTFPSLEAQNRYLADCKTHGRRHQQSVWTEESPVLAPLRYKYAIQFLDALGLPQVRRQELAAEPLVVAAASTVMRTRLLDGDLADARDDFPIRKCLLRTTWRWPRSSVTCACCSIHSAPSPSMVWASIC